MKTGSKEEFWKNFLCRGFTNSPIDIHKSNLESSHLFGITSLNSYSIQNQEFYLKTEKDANWSKHGCIFLKKNEILILKTLNEWFLAQDFQRYLLRKVFDFKIKGISMKTTKHKKWNTEQYRRKRIHKVNFWTIRVNKVVGMEANLYYFLMTYENQIKDKIIIATNQRCLDQVN